MPIEIEAKLKVESLPKIARRLKAVGGEFICQKLQRDTYLDESKSALRKSDSALRIRRQRVGRKEHTVLTFKGSRQKGRFKRREELEFEVGDGLLAKQLLGVLGYKEKLTIEKKRRIWRLGDCEVSLDELPLLGSFVEIEGASEKKIAAVQKKLGLADMPHIPESYTVLMEKKLGQLKIKRREILF